MRRLLRLHRILALLLAVQIIIWLVSGFYFSWLGHTELSGETYAVSAAKPTLERAPAIQFETIVQQYPRAWAIQLHEIEEQLQYVVQVGETHLFINADTGTTWHTSLAMAEHIAIKNYAGSAQLTDVQSLDLATVLPQQSGPGYAFSFADNQQTVIYVNAASAAVAGYGNRYSTLTDWMFRLHFMDYSGQRDFNNLWNRALGLLFLFFTSSGIIIIARQLAARRQTSKRKR